MLIPQHQQRPLLHLKLLLLVPARANKPATPPAIPKDVAKVPNATPKAPIPETTIPTAARTTPITVAIAVKARTMPPVMAIAFCTGPGKALNPSTSFCKPATKH